VLTSLNSSPVFMAKKMVLEVEPATVTDWEVRVRGPARRHRRRRVARRGDRGGRERIVLIGAGGTRRRPARFRPLH
jgi:hypothetical protein